MGMGKAVLTRSFLKKPRKAKDIQKKEYKGNPLVAWIALAVIWYLTVFQMAVNFFGEGIMMIVFSLVGLLVLKALFLKKLMEVV